MVDPPRLRTEWRRHRIRIEDEEHETVAGFLMNQTDKIPEPGDEVAFTIRFDNIGNQTIGNVTIIDNLSPRLEYVADSAQCSLAAEFFTEPNDGDSLVVRCEVADPIESGDGGVVRFRCRVR